jgi:hypothetical protein
MLVSRTNGFEICKIWRGQTESLRELEGKMYGFFNDPYN